MQISLVGISHKTAPVAVREHYAFAPDEAPALLARLGERYAGAALLSTCNRTEIYVAAPHALGDPRAIAALLSDVKGEPPIEGVPFFSLHGSDAARHLFRVAAGIESMVVGESEILGQVRGAFTAATAAGTHTAALSRLFHDAIRVGRRVRTQTEIGRLPVSVSSTAIALARRTLGDLSAATVLVVGAGDAGQLTAGNLAGSGVRRMLVTSRNPERTAALAQALEGEAVPFERREDAVAEADIVITSTAAHEFVIDAPLVERAIARRPQRPLLLVDIAVPRDVDPAVRAFPGVHLYDIDELQAEAQANLQLRRQEMAAAETIVDEQVARFSEWLRSLQVVPTVAALRARGEAARDAELRRTLDRMRLSDDDRRRVEAMASALVKRLLHDPIARLKDPDDGERYVEPARALFNLDGAAAPPEAGADLTDGDAG